MVQFSTKKKIVFLSGIDGSGKTTLAKALIKTLRANGTQATYLWCRWGALFTYPLLFLCRMFGYTQRKDDLIIRNYYKNKAIAFLWSFFYPLDYALCSLMKLQISRKDSIIVLDRFIPDILVDVTLHTHINAFKSFIGNFLLGTLKRKNIRGIVLDVDEKTAIARKEDIPSPNYIRFRRPMYLKLARLMGWKVLDGQRSVKENLNEILEMVNNEYQ